MQLNSDQLSILHGLYSQVIHKWGDKLDTNQLVKDEIVDSVPQESRYIDLYKSQNNGNEPPFNFNNKGKSPKKMGLTKEEFVKQDLKERLDKAKKLCQNVLL